MVTSPAYKIRILNSLTDMRKGNKGYVGGPLDFAPIVQVLDSSGNPLAGN